MLKITHGDLWFGRGVSGSPPGIAKTQHRDNVPGAGCCRQVLQPIRSGNCNQPR